MFDRKSLSALIIILALILTSSFAYAGHKGVTVDIENGTIYIMDTDTNIATGPFFSGIYYDLCDIVLTLDQNTAIVSSFHDYIIAFVDITDPVNPQIIGEVDFSSTPDASHPFHPEDLAITPNGKFVLASDGKENEGGYDIDMGVASIDVQTETLVEFLILDPNKQAQSVSVDKYGNVYAGDNANQKLYILDIDLSTGALSDSGIEFDLPFAPLNSYTSPDGDNLIVVGKGGLVVFNINGAGDIIQGQSITDLDGDGNDDDIQSAAYSADGTALYLADNSTDPDRVIIMDVNPDGTLSFSGTTIDLLTDFTKGWFGIDVMALEPDGNTLYIGNMSDGDEQGDIVTNGLMILDLTTYQLTTMALPGAIPTATAFKKITSPPDIDIAPLNIDFGSVTIGSSSNAVVTITSIGGTDLEIGTLTITGPDALDFSILDDNCSNQTIVPGEICTVEIRFSPNTDGVKNANLNIPSNVPITATQTDTQNVQLMGNGILPPPQPQQPRPPLFNPHVSYFIPWTNFNYSASFLSTPYLSYQSVQSLQPLYPSYFFFEARNRYLYPFLFIGDYMNLPTIYDFNQYWIYYK